MALTKVTGAGVGTLTSGISGTDITLSGGVYLGGTGSANYLDDYEEGTWVRDDEFTEKNPYRRRNQKSSK